MIDGQMSDELGGAPEGSQMGGQGMVNINDIALWGMDGQTPSVQQAMPAVPEESRKNQEAERERALGTLHAVWLYDDDENARRTVDEDGEFFMYSNPSIRHNEEDLYVYGKDYAHVAAPWAEDEPLSLCEQYLGTIKEPVRKEAWRKELETLKASGRDTKRDYYALLAKLVRDDVRVSFKRQQERDRHAQQLTQEGRELIESMLMGREMWDLDRINQNEEMARLLATDDGNSRVKSMRRAAYAMRAVVDAAAADKHSDFTPANALAAIDSAADWLADETGGLDPVAAKLFADNICQWSQQLQDTGLERGFGDRFRDSMAQMIGNIIESESLESHMELRYQNAKGRYEAPVTWRENLMLWSGDEAIKEERRKAYEQAKAEYEKVRPKAERIKLVQGYINQAVDQGRVLDAENAAWWERASAAIAASAPSTMVYAACGWSFAPATLAASAAGSYATFTNEYETNASEGIAGFFTENGRMADVEEKIGIYTRAAQDAGIDTAVEMLPGMAIGFPATRLLGALSKGGGKVGSMARYAARLGEKRWGAAALNLSASAMEEAVFEPLAAGIMKGASDQVLEAAGVPNFQARGWGIVTDELTETWSDSAQLGSILATCIVLGGGHLPQTVKMSKSLQQQSAEWALAGLSEESVAQARLSATPEETAARLYQEELNSDPEAMARRIREQREKQGEQTDENLRRTGLRSEGDEAAALSATWKQLVERGLMPHVEAVPSVDGKEQYRLTERDAEGKEKVMLMDAAETDAYLTIRSQHVMKLSVGTLQASVFDFQDEMLRGLYGEAAATAIRRNADKTGVAIQDVSEVEGVTEEMVKLARQDKMMSQSWLTQAAERIGGMWRNISSSFTQRLKLEGIKTGGTRAFRAKVERESSMDGRKVFSSLVTYVNGGASVADLMEEALESHTDMTLQVRAAELQEANPELTAPQAMEQALQEMAEKVKPVLQAMAKMDYGANRAIKAMAEESNWEGDKLFGTVLEAISHIQKSRLLAEGDILPAAWREGVAQATDALGFMDDIRRWGELYKQLKDSGTDVAGIEEYFAKQSAFTRTVFEQARVDEQVIASWERAQQFQNAKAEGAAGTGAVSATRAVDIAEKHEEEIRKRERAEAAVPELDKEEEAAQKEAFKSSAEQAVRQTVAISAPNAPSNLDGVFAGNVCTYNEEGDYYRGDVLVARLRDSKDVEQVKQGTKGKHGVINPLVGDYQKDAPPIFVWHRKNGAYEVISGRHRYALALATGTTAIPAYVYEESETHNLKWARLLDFENNMRDDQADELTAAIYVRETGFDDMTLTRKGLMRDGTKSRRGILIGREAREELWTRFRNRAVSPMDAEKIVIMTKNIRDTGRIEEIQRRCCMLLDERKSWEYIGAMVQLMANKESVFMKQGLLDLGADFEADLARAAKYIETCTKQLNEAISVMKSGRKMSGKQADLARRLGQLTTSAEDSQQRLDALTTMKAMFDNIGMYPDLVAGAQMWDGKTEIDAVGMALERGMREAQENAEEDGLTVEERLERAEAEAARKAAEEATGSLFSFSVTPEMEDIKARAMADGTFMKAPNGQPTNLTERQWLQVRTKAFKDWFGDWETIARFRAAYSQIMGMEPVQSLSGNEFKHGVTPDSIASYWKNACGSSVTRSDIGEVVLNKRGAKDCIAHGAMREKFIAFAAVPEVIRKGVVFDSKSNWKGRGYDTCCIAAPITIAGNEYVCQVVVKMHPDHKQFYVHEVELKTKLPTETETGFYAGPESGGAKGLLAQKAEEVNTLLENCSKTVDENGEPKVVYHQTAGGFTVFNTKYQLAGRYDSETPEGFFLKPTAADIGLRGKEQMALYLKAGNVLEFASRDEAVRYWKKNVDGYAGLSDKLESMDADYEKRTNEAEKEADDWYYNHSDEDVTSEEIEQSCAKLDRLVDEWKRETNEVRLRLKGLINGYIRQSGYDAMHITRDAGAFGRSVETYIAFAPTQIKSATGNRGTFDAGNADITFSVAEQKKMDAHYMEAVERGDMAEAGRMVREYAAKRGYIPQDKEYWMNHRPMAEGSEKKTPEQRMEDGDALSLLDLAHGYWNVPEDFFEHPELYDPQPGSREAAYKVRDLIERAKKWLAGDIKTEPCIKCYRAVPKEVKEDTPRNGDWVTPSREYAEEHIRHSLDGKGRVQVFSAKVGELYFNGDSVMEFGYHDGNDYAYRNTKNNRKLLSPVTYEDVEVRAEDGEFEGVDLGEWNAETKRFDWVPYRYNMERRVVPLSKRFNPKENSVSFSVVGENAANWEELKKTHKVFNGRDDGKPRIELDTSKARLKKSLSAFKAESKGQLEKNKEAIYAFLFSPEARKQAAEILRRLRAGEDYKQLVKAYSQAFKYAANGATHNGNWVAILEASAAGEAGAAVKRIVTQVANKAGVVYKLGDVLDFKELYRAYPKLKKMPVRFGVWQGSAMAYYRPLANDITVSFTKVGDGNFRSTMLHEVQHAIQQIEGFAKGGNSRSAGALADARHKGMSGYEKYLRLAGEIEARNVQKRADWYELWRDAQPFNDTLEYPGEAIVSFSVIERADKTRYVRVESPVYTEREARDILTAKSKSMTYVGKKGRVFGKPGCGLIAPGTTYEVFIMKSSIESILSGRHVGESVSPEVHYAAAGVLDELWLASRFLVDHEDTKGKPGRDIRQMHRRKADMHLEGKVYEVKLTAKEYATSNDTNTLYMLKVEGIKEKSAKASEEAAGTPGESSPIADRRMLADGERIVKQESADFPGSFSVTSYAERQRAVREKMNEMALRDAQTNELIQELAKEGQDLRLGGKKSQQEAMAALARVEALVNRTRAMLPPKLAKLGRLDKTLAWVRVYSDMVQSGEVKLNEKITSTAITQKFIDKMNKSRDEALLHGLSEEEAQDVLRNIGAERLGETLARVTDFCTARLTALLKERSLDAIMALARRITWQMQDNTMQDLEQMEAELRDSLLAAGENVDLRQAERVLKRIERKRLDLLKRMVEEAYKNAFPKKQPGQRSPRGKMDAESYRMLMRMHEAMSMTAEQVNDRQTEIEALLGKLEETAPDYEEKRVQLEDELMLLGAFGNWEGMDVGKAADAAKQFLEFVQTSRTAWQAKLEDEKQYYAYLRELMSQNFTVEDTPNTRSAGKQAQDVKGSTRQTVEHVAVNLMNYGQLMRAAAPKLGQKFTLARRNEISAANAGLANDNRAFETAFYHFVADACGSANGADCIKWLNKFAEVTSKSGVFVQEGKVGNLVMDTEEARKWVAMSKEEREQRREEIAKADAARMRKTLDIPTEEDIPALQAELANMDSRVRVLKNGTEVDTPSQAGKVKIRRQGRRDMVELGMSRDQALNLILILEQEDYRHLISHWGFIPVDSMGNEVYNPDDNLGAIDVRKSLASLYKFVGEDGLKLGYHMRGYVGENGKRLAKCFEEYNGVPLNMREKYWKGNFNISPLKEKDQLTDAGSMAGSGYSFMIDRVLHFNREELTNSATLIFGQTMQEQLNYIHTAHITRLWRRLLQDAEFANLMRANMGEDWMRGIKTWMNVIDKANGAGELNMWRMTKLQSALMRGAAVAALSGNIQTIVKQSSAVIHALLGGEVPYKVVANGEGAVEFAWRGLGLGNWVGSMAHVVAGRGKVSAAAIRASEWYQARIDSDKKHIASRMGLAAGEVQHAYTGRIAEKGMEVMETVDRWSNLVSCCALADAVYRQMETLNTQNKLGLSAEQMEREALQAVGRMLNEVAQPKMATQKTLATAAKPYGVSLGGFLTMFRSEMLNKLGMLCARAKEGEFAAGLGNYLAFGAFNAAVSMLLAYIRFGGGKDDKDEWWRTLAAFGYESMFADMYAIPIAGDALKYGESKLTGKYFHDAGVFGVFGIDRASKGIESLYEAAEGGKDLTAQQYAKHTQNVLRTASLLMQTGRAFGVQNTWFGTVMEGVLDAATTANVVRTVTDVAERVKK